MSTLTTGQPAQVAADRSGDDVATSVSPGAGTLWRSARGPLAVGLVLVLLGLLLAYASSTRHQGGLDPRSVSPSGSRAVASLLSDEGVQVDLVRTTAEARRQAARPDTTMLVAVPDLLDERQRGTLADVGSDVVLVTPGQPALRTFLPGARTSGTAPVGTRDPACDLPAARAAGAATTGGQRYRVSEAGGDPAGEDREVSLCYAAGGEASLVSAETGDRAVTVLGAPDPLTNDQLDEAGNAALAMRLLGEHERLVWFLPDPQDSLGGPTRSVTDLIPDAFRWAGWQLAAAVLLLALWRMRRLGPVVTEPLPVVVRASETVEGRSRLYRRARASDRAADALRTATRDRLLPLLGLPPGADPGAVVQATAERTGRDNGEVGALLYGAAPGDDAALVRLADQLDTLEREVQRT